VHGGDGEFGDGTFNVMLPERDLFPTAENIRFGPGHGSSFVQVVTWGAGRCPKASMILAYSLSENPASPHRADQTRLYSRKRWVRGRFCESQIKRSPHLEVKRIRGRSR
jgi:acyl-homoserine-lactone acylase